MGGERGGNMRFAQERDPWHIEEFRISTSLEDSHWWYRGVYALVRKFLPQNQDKKPRVLDVGCGSGGLLRALRSEASCVGLDVAQDALINGRTAGTEALIRACAELLPMSDNVFDVVISVDVLCHETCDAAGALREIYRTLKPCGTLLLHLPAYEWLKGPHDRAGRNRKRYNAGEVRSLLTAAGFSVHKLTYRIMLLFPMACAWRLIQKMIRGESKCSDVRPLPIWLNTLLGAIIDIEMWLLRWMNLPFGLSIFAVATKPSVRLSQK